MNLQKLNQYNPEPNQKLSEDGKFTKTYYTTKEINSNNIIIYKNMKLLLFLVKKLQRFQVGFNKFYKFQCCIFIK